MDKEKMIQLANEIIDVFQKEKVYDSYDVHGILGVVRVHFETKHMIVTLERRQREHEETNKLLGK